MVTIKQIAERAGVSTTTVSNVIHGNIKRVSPENVEKIQRLIQEMGYVERIGFHVLQKTGSKLIAVIIQQTNNYSNTILTDPFYGTVTSAIEHCLHESGYYMIFYSSNDINDLFHMAMSCDVDGIIAISFSYKNCEKLYNCVKKPIITIDAYGPVPENYSLPNISLDDKNAGLLLGDFLFEKGYRDIFFCSQGQQLQYSENDVDSCRLLGLQQSWEKIRSNGGSASKPKILYLGPTEAARRSAYQEIIRHVPFKHRTAYVFCSDYLALEALNYLTERGISVPDQIGIVGFDDILYASRFSKPGLTTIHQDIRRKGELAVLELIRKIKEPDYQPKSYKLPVTLIKRQSV